MTGEASLLAIQDSAREIFGRELDHERKKMAGRLDPTIWRDLCAVNGIEGAERHLPRFREVFARRLDRRLAELGSAHSLRGAGADRVVPDLTSTDDVAAWILDGG